MAVREHPAGDRTILFRENPEPLLVSRGGAEVVGRSPTGRGGEDSDGPMRLPARSPGCVEG